VVERLILPERFAHSPQKNIRFSGGGTLQSVGDAAEGSARRKEQVNVIGHHDEGMERKVAQHLSAATKRIEKEFDDAGILQPAGATGGGVEQNIESAECATKLKRLELHEGASEADCDDKKWVRVGKPRYP
jgi:hypothetical protein